ncbi:hypothetical protein Areg01_43950 [Actinoplanes regularis]|nr:hypothetical protein Areg01_43950 [Actinoplanes regularis]
MSGAPLSDCRQRTARLLPRNLKGGPMVRGTVRAPKPDEQRRRRNAPAHGETVLPRDEEVRGRALGRS